MSSKLRPQWQEDRVRFVGGYEMPAPHAEPSHIGSTLPNMPMNDWYCPHCDETNCDFINIPTHCGNCGLVVFHNDGDVVEIGGFIEGYAGYDAAKKEAGA